MKKYLKYVGIFFAAMFVITIIIAVTERMVYGPTQAFIFFNTSNEARSITFNKIFEDGTVEKMYTIDTILKPNNVVYKNIPADNYQIQIWDSKEYLVDSFDLKIVLEDSTKSETNAYRIDLALDKVFAVVNLNALYEKSVFSYSNNETLKLGKLYDGKAPFFVDKQYTIYTFIDIHEDLPSSIKARQTLYGLFAIPASLPESELLSYIVKQIEPKMN